MASKWIVEQKKQSALKAKRVKEKEVAKKNKLPDRSENCEVCKTPTRNFNARINVKSPRGNLIVIGICGNCVRKGYTFDKYANVIQKQ